MKKSDYSLIIGKDYYNKKLYSLIRFHDYDDGDDIILQTKNKHEMKMRLDIMGLKFKNYQVHCYGSYGQVWFK